MNVITVEEEVFRTRTIFVVNCSNKEAEKFIKRKYEKEVEIEEDVDATVLCFTKKGCRKERVVWLEQFSLNHEDLGCLNHEIFHLAVRICEDRGVPIVANIETGEVGDETAAYLADFYTRQFLEKYAQTKKRRKPKKIRK